MTQVDCENLQKLRCQPWSFQACPSEIGRTSSNLKRDTYTLKYSILLKSLGFFGPLVQPIFPPEGGLATRMLKKRGEGETARTAVFHP